uniref:Uncharacterized protein n=1 Tax=Amphimedon queenslandica TaxID=400682 RepID=A0A1X7TZN3_AMPQE
NTTKRSQFIIKHNKI